MNLYENMSVNNNSSDKQNYFTNNWILSHMSRMDGEYQAPDTILWRLILMPCVILMLSAINHCVSYCKDF